MKINNFTRMAVLSLGIAVMICGCGAGEEPGQIMLSWSGNPQSSQGISWSGNESYDGYVQYMEQGAADVAASFSEDRQQAATRTEVREDEYYRYKADLTELKPGTKYLYRVGCGRTWSETKSFVTAPESGDKFTFMYLGDVQYEIRDRDYGDWGSMVKAAYERNTGLAFGLSGGDMVDSSGDVEDWSLFLDNAQPVFSEIPFMSSPGNHETSVIPYTYLQMMNVPGEFYSFDYGDCHIAVLNSCIFMPERIVETGRSGWKALIKRTNEWLKGDLAKSRAKWKLAVMHHPAFPIKEDSAIYRKIRENWVPLFEDGEVDLVLCGHQHVYMRSKEINGITYIMANSGRKRSHYYDEEEIPQYAKVLDIKNSTYQIFTVKKDTLSMNAYDEEGTVIDKWEKGEQL